MLNAKGYAEVLTFENTSEKDSITLVETRTRHQPIKPLNPFFQNPMTRPSIHSRFESWRDAQKGVAAGEIAGTVMSGYAGFFAFPTDGSLLATYEFMQVFRHPNFFIFWETRQ